MKKNISVATLGFIVMLVLMRFQGNGLVIPNSPLGILNLEFADTAAKMQNLLAHWDLATVQLNIWLDFIFIISYVYFLSAVAEACALKWPKENGMRQTGLFLEKLAYAAGLFDIVENLLMLQTINGHYNEHSLQLTFYCAAFKFLLIAILLVYFVLSVPALIKNKD